HGPSPVPDGGSRIRELRGPRPASLNPLYSQVMSSSSKRLTAVATTIQFDAFWRWLGGHVNCILRAGTTEAVLFDHEDFHWTIADEDDHTRVIQVARGKELVGELVVFPAEISYIQMEPSETEGEWLFE